jgi:hypothetical protein
MNTHGPLRVVYLIRLKMYSRSAKNVQSALLFVVVAIKYNRIT